MKQIYSILILSLIISNKGFAQGGVIILEGNYQGKNLYVQNPFGSGGVGFCVTEVLVNGNITTDETNSSAFEIDFKSHKLAIGEKVEIKINLIVQRMLHNSASIFCLSPVHHKLLVQQKDIFLFR